MISYIKQQRKNPLTQDLAWYPAISINTTVGVDEVVIGIVEKCTLTKVDVKAVLIALEEVVIEQLKAGNSVRFGTLGSFRPSLKTRVWNDQNKRYEHGGCPVADTVYDDKTGKVLAQGVTDDNIDGLSVCFTKSGEIGKKLDRSQLQFKGLNVKKEYPTT